MRCQRSTESSPYSTFADRWPGVGLLIQRALAAIARASCFGASSWPDREMEITDLRNCYGSLTRRERQVMALVVSGLLNKLVGGELGISEITVKAHRGQFMQKNESEFFGRSGADGVRSRARAYDDSRGMRKRVGLYAWKPTLHTRN